jgi:nucleoside 2-deoxyribosyltransferase
MDNPYSPIKVYIAAPFEERNKALFLKAVLVNRGAIVTSTWLTDADGNTANMAAIQDRFHDCRCRAVKDYQDIDAADVFLLYKPLEIHRKPTTGGHHVETGYAQGKGKPIVLFGARENVFHYRAGVYLIAPDALAALCDYLHISQEPVGENHG